MQSRKGITLARALGKWPKRALYAVIVNGVAGQGHLALKLGRVMPYTMARDAWQLPAAVLE